MDEKKSKNFLNEKNLKIIKQLHAYRGYVCTNNLEILKMRVCN